MLRVSPLGQGYFTCFLLMSFSFLYYVTAMGMLHQEAWSHQTGARKASNGSKPNSPRLPLNFEQRNNQIPKIWAIFLWMMSGKMAGEPKNQMALNPPTPATPAPPDFCSRAMMRSSSSWKMVEDELVNKSRTWQTTEICKAQNATNCQKLGENVGLRFGLEA